MHEPTHAHAMVRKVVCPVLFFSVIIVTIADISVFSPFFFPGTEVNSSDQQPKIVSPASDEHVQGTHSDPLVPTHMRAIIHGSDENNTSFAAVIFQWSIVTVAYHS